MLSAGETARKATQPAGLSNFEASRIDQQAPVPQQQQNFAQQQQSFAQPGGEYATVTPQGGPPPAQPVVSLNVSDFDVS